MEDVKFRQVHLDFHTATSIKEIGKDFSEENFISCLKKGHVNSITLFAKCHHGWSYYPSKVNLIHPNLKFDLLSAQLTACKKAGVCAPIYISVGYDDKYFFAHPEHAVRQYDGKPVVEIGYKDGLPYAKEDWLGFHRLCLNTPYLDEVVRQTEEVMQTFNPEGLFFDIVGECVCYCDHCRRTVKELGLDESKAESFEIVAKLTYKKCCNALNSAARKYNKEVKLFYNAGHIKCGDRENADFNTHLELESLPTGGWGYDHFPKSAKYASELGKEYLGMTGKFHNSWGEFGGFKHPNALRYETALSLAFGAKCSVGDQMHPYAFLDDATYELIGTAYSEVEKVEEYVDGAKQISEVAVLFGEAFSNDSESHAGCMADTGAVRVLLEGKYLFSVIDAKSNFDGYKLIILPDEISLKGEVETIEKLKAFAKNGGKILATGKVGEIILNELDLGSKFVEKSSFSPNYYAPNYSALNLTKTNYVVYADAFIVDKAKDGEVLANIKPPMFNRDKYRYCSHKHTPFGDDVGTPAVTIGKNGGYVAFNVFTEYATVGSFIAKETALKTIEKILDGEKLIVADLPSYAVVTLSNQEKEKRLVMHVLSVCPIKRGNGVEVIEDVVPLYDKAFVITTDKQIKKVKLVPKNKEIDFTLDGDKVTFILNEINLKQVVVLKY